MLKNIIKLELEIASKTYHFLFDNDSPLEHIKESLFQFTKLVGQIEDQIKQQQKPPEETAQPQEPSNG